MEPCLRHCRRGSHPGTGDPSCALPDDAAQDSWRSRLQDACPHLTAEAIYNFLLERQYPADVLAELTQLFSRDSHALWYVCATARLRPAPNGQLLPAGEDEDITNETELRKTDIRGRNAAADAAAAEGNPAQTMEAAWPARPRPIWRPSAAVTASVPEH